MDSSPRPTWTFLSNHAHVLIFLSLQPEARLRDIADAVGVTERFAHRVVADLEEAGYLSSEKMGRRKIYTVNNRLPFRHPLEQGAEISQLLEIFTDAQRPAM